VSIIPKCLQDYDNYLLKYIFTREARQRISKYDLEIILNDVEIRNRVKELLEETLKHGKSSVKNWDIDRELLSHYLTLLIGSQLPKKYWIRYANAESKLFSENLRKDLEFDKECLLYIARNSFDFKVINIVQVLNEIGLNISHTFTGKICPEVILIQNFEIAIPVIQYIKYCPKNDPNWKLINRYVVKGYVLLNYEDLVRLIEEAVKKYIINQLEKNSGNDIVKNLIDKLCEIDDDIKKLMDKYSKYTVLENYSGKEISGIGTYPPCIEAIINDIKSGGNPSHIARFTVAAFLLRVLTEYEGKSIEEAVEEVVNLFRTVADFDEKITRYQVEHIAGLIGGRKFYMPPNCDELISLGLCPNNGACGVKNPLVAYLKLKKKSRKIKSKDRNQEK